jgi:hypothetical protein
MQHLDAKILTVVTLAAVLASLLARLLAWRFRRAMQALMQVAVADAAGPLAAGVSPTPPAPVPAPTPPTTPAVPQPLPVTLADNRRAAWRLSALLVLLTALVALGSAVVTLALPGFSTGLTLRRALVLALAQTWPVIPVLALLWRWPRGRTLAALAAWAVLAAGVLALNSDGAQPLRDGAVYLAVDASFAALWALLLCAGAAPRAIAPWLLLPVAAVLAGAVAGLDVLEAATVADGRVQDWQAWPAWLVWTVGHLGAWPTLALFTVLPLLALLWPARRLGQALADAWRRRWLSELLVLFTVLTGLALLQRALTSLSSTGGASLALLLPVLLVPPLVLLAAPRRPPGQPPGRVPVLLVLRVFQRDRAVAALFDRVIERWRLTGNTLLIAGTDLLERTLDADDLWAFIGRRLRGRFVLDSADLARRLGDLDLQADLDGRHRVNELYCHDRTWQTVLDALVARADVVLMDLRGFQKRNRGCAHELAVLARAPRLARVVVLVDGDTDLAAARAAAAGAPPGRFDWLDATGAAGADVVLPRLFVAPAAAGSARA